MDTKRLCNALEEALTVIPSHTPTLWLNVWMHDANSNSPRADPHAVELLRVLRSEPELQVFDRTTMHTGLNGAWAIELWNLGGWLLKRAMSVGTSQAVDDLTTYLTVSELPCEMTLIVSGLAPEKACELGRGISFIPWAELPESDQKQSMNEYLFRGQPSHFFHSTLSALIREHRSEKRYVSQAEFQRDMEQYTTPPVDASELNDALMCLALVGPYGPHILASWMSLPVWAPLSSNSMMLPRVEGFSPGKQISTDECSQARDLFAAFCAAPSLQTHLRLVTQRLIRAVRRYGTPVDASIDLGIALEGLYLSDMQDDRGELSFRLRMRAARLLGATEENRKHIFTLMGDIYTLRSIAVHTGTLTVKPKDLHGRTVQQVLEEGFFLTAKAIRQFITSGKPRWDTIMFG